MMGRRKKKKESESMALLGVIAQEILFNLDILMLAQNV